MSKKIDYPTLLSSSIRPQDDFFQYVNSQWMKEHPIPKSEVRWGTFDILRNESQEAMRAIYENLQANDYALGTVEQQARDFYYAGMHYDEFEASHLALLRDYFAKIDEITDTRGLAAMIGTLNQLQLGAPWYVWVDTDHDDSTRHILHIYQSGLTLPNRDYYLDDSAPMKKFRAEYKKYVERVFAELPQLGKNKTDAWQTIMSFETDIAKVSRSAPDLRDVEKNFNKTTFAALRRDYPAIDWEAYAASLGWTSPKELSVAQPEFLQFAAEALKTKSLDSWKTYLKWRIASRCLPRISQKFSDLHFSFFGKVLSGTPEIQPLWKRVVQTLDMTIGEATGQLYVQKHFPESSKQQMIELVEDLRSAYQKRIEKLSWMSSPTKKYAKKKLANIKVLIGYPDKWRDFTSLLISRESYLGNVLEAQKFDMAYWLGRLDEPTSRDDWMMNPQTVNAYHDPNRLVICFPAAILQAPFFDPKAPLAANMGGIGMVIGHELTHGFDDQGCQFDAKGNVRQWQTDKERKAFTQLAEGIVEQADMFEVLPGLTLKGKLVLGESIADLGGVEIALEALRAKIDDLETHAVGSLTHTQLFFINYAFTQCSNIREEKLREFTLNDPHPAAIFRVNGILQHVNNFYDAFDIQTKDKLYRKPTQRVKIW